MWVSLFGQVFVRSSIVLLHCILFAVVNYVRIIVDLNLVGIPLTAVHRKLTRVLLAQFLYESREMVEFHISFALFGDESVPYLQNSACFSRTAPLYVKEVLVDVDLEDSHSFLHTNLASHSPIHLLLLKNSTRILPSSSGA